MATDTSGPEREFKDPWAAASAMSDGCTVEVEYEPASGEGLKTKSGEVASVTARGGVLNIRFRRDDGTLMALSGSGDLETPASRYPFVGDMSSVEVRGPEEVVDAPEPAETPWERAIVAAEKYAMGRTGPSTTAALQEALDVLEAEGVSPKEDWSTGRFEDWLDDLMGRIED